MEKTLELKENFSALMICFAIFLPFFIYFFITWMRKNNGVRATVSTDSGRNFETKVLSIVLIAMTIFLEIVFLFLMFSTKDSIFANVAVTIIQIAIFVVKLMVFNIFFIVVRWTLPRFRYDQVQTLGWNYLLPISIANIFVTALVIVGVN